MSKCTPEGRYDIVSKNTFEMGFNFFLGFFLKLVLIKHDPFAARDVLSIMYVALVNMFDTYVIRYAPSNTYVLWQHLELIRSSPS